MFDARLYGEALPHVHSLCYLGVWFDEHLTWDRHIREVVARAWGRLWELQLVCWDQVGRAPPLVFADGERRHSSSIILWGAMLGVGFVFEWVHCTVGWSIGSCWPIGLYIGAEYVRRGVQGTGGPFLSPSIHYAGPHTVFMAPASLRTLESLPSLGARALCHPTRVGESKVHTSRLGSYTHYPNTTEEKTSL